MLSFLTPITVFPCRLKLCSVRKYIKWANGKLVVPLHQLIGAGTTNYKKIYNPY